MTRLTRIAALALLLPGLALASSIGGVGGGGKSREATRTKVQQSSAGQQSAQTTQTTAASKATGTNKASTTTQVKPTAKTPTVQK